MEAPPRCGADLEGIWQSSGGPVHDLRDLALSALVLPHTSSSSLGQGFICIPSPDRSAPGSSGESALGQGPSSLSSPIPAGLSMNLGPDYPSRRLFVGDSRQEGSPLSGGAFPPPGVLELWV